MAQPLIALLLSGGGGTRLWPLSTEQGPKQFLKLFGSQSLFQQTWLRAEASGASALVVMANQAQNRLIHDDLAELPDALGQTRVVYEPMRRDSGPAIAAGVADCLNRFGPEGIGDGSGLRSSDPRSRCVPRDCRSGLRGGQTGQDGDLRYPPDGACE